MNIQNSFLDIRNHGFRRVATIVPRVHVADPETNAAEHIIWLEQAWKQGVKYALFPELSLTGYTCGDLFHSDGLHRAKMNALKRLLRWSRDHASMLFSVGLPLVLDGMLFNTAAMIQNGRVLAIVPKAYPPNYREFYEGRHFARAAEAISTVVAIFSGNDQDHDDDFDQMEVPFGTDILLMSDTDSSFVLHMEICEDGWVPISPGTEAALAGATLLANHSASNITVGKADYRENLMVGSSGRNLCVQMYCAAGYGESSSAMSWDGDAYIAERGSLVARSERFAINGTMTMADVDLHVLVLDRMRQTSFRQNAVDHRSAFRRVAFSETGDSAYGHEPLCTLLREIDPLPFVPHDPARLDERCYETFNIMATALVRRFERLPPHMRHAFFGFSGGRDSLLILLAALRAMEILGLPRTNIHCFSLPGLGTSAGTLEIARALPEALGTSFKEISIVEMTRVMFGFMGLDPNKWDADEETKKRFENAQALTRKHVVFCESNQRGIVLGTGDLSEAAVGWCTYGADQFSYYNVNGGVPKTLVSHLIDWSAKCVFTSDADAEARRQIENALGLEISPELLPADVDGAIAQKTEDVIGPFELIDFFIYHFVRFGRRPQTIARIALHAFREQYTIGDIKKWLASFLERFFAAQAKRASMPEGPKVGLACLDPRGDWRMPSDIKADAWLRDLEAVPDTLDD